MTIINLDGLYAFSDSTASIYISTEYDLANFQS